MNERHRISGEVTVGGQVGEGEIQKLPAEGFKTVVNLREPGEEDQPLAPDEERKLVEQAGLAYVHIPVSGKDMKPELVDRFRRELERLPSPAFVHCHKGKRAGAFAMMAAAVDAGWSGAQTLETAERMGFECDTPELKQFVTRSVDSHRSA